MLLQKNAAASRSGFAPSAARRAALVVAAPAPAPARGALLRARAQGEFACDIDKPTGLKLAQSTAAGGGVVVKGVSGNAAKSGIKPGDTIIYASSFFGDELWPADKLGFTNSAINAAPSPVSFVYVRGENDKINVKRLPKRPAPPRFGRKLTSKQRELATHVCVDCGWVYAEVEPFEDTPQAWRCPQCNAPKRRMVTYDADKGKGTGVAEGTLGTVATVVGGIAGIAILAYVASTI